MSRTTWITVTLKAETDRAWLVDGGIDKDIWIPKSQIEDYSESEYASGDTLEIEIPEWLAIEKELV